MKKIKFLTPALIFLCAGLFAGYSAWDRINTDKKAPEITIGTETIQVSVSAPRSDLLQGITAQDDRDGDVTDSMVVESIKALDSDGTIEVSFAAFDQAGNVAKSTRTVRYTDYHSPRFSLSRSLVYPYGNNFDPLTVISATDCLDGSLQSRIRAMSLDNDSVSALGDHQVEFRVTNSLGDTVRLTLPVTVYSSDIYSIGVSLREYLIYLKPGTAFDADSYLSAIGHGHSTYTADALPANYSVHISGDVKTGIPGVYPVDYTVTCAQESSSGTQYVSGFNRLIVIVEG